MYIIPQFKADELLFYLRKSRSDDPLLTIEEVLQRHEQRLDEWARNYLQDGSVVAEEARFREVVSGETISSRPRMQELLLRVESPKIKAIVVVEAARLSRGDLEEIGYLVKILRYTNTIVITLDRGAYDLNDERDRQDFERELMKSNDFLEYQKKIMHAGKLVSIKQNGNYIGNIPPYGYKKISYKENGRTVHTLEVVPEHAEVVKRIYKMYLDGMGATGIADQLTAEHIPTPTGKERWAAPTLTSLLQNPHYLGKVVWERQRLTKRVEDGKIIHGRTKFDDFILAEGRHEAIIDQELYDAVQAKRGRHARAPRKHKMQNAFAGLIYCRGCGYAVTRKTPRTPGTKPAFMCSVRRGCGCGSCDEAVIFDKVSLALREAIANFEAQIDAGTDNSAELHRAKIERLEKRLVALRETEVKQWDEKLKGGMPEHVFQKLNDATVAEIEEVQTRLHEARETMPVSVNIEERVATFREALSILNNPKAPSVEKNKLLKACIDRITYFRERQEGVGKIPEKERKERPVFLHIDFRV